MKTFDKAISWLYRHGRPIDVARYEYLFLSRDKDTCINALISYQNEDGGFGHGLEPDSQNPFSSPVTTWMAFEIMEELELDNSSEIVKNTLRYLTEDAPMKDGFYLSTIPTNNNYPHAAWWTYSSEGSVWGYNPTAAIIGFIYKYAMNKKQKNTASEMIQKAIHSFIQKPSDNMHEIRCFIDMVNFIDDDLSKFNENQKFSEILLKQIDHNLEKDSSLWFKTYCVRPLQFFDRPFGFGFDKFQNLAELEANMILDSLNKDGIWDVTWNWENYKEEEAIAMRDWKSSLIIGYLKILKAYKII
ncbi:MAG: hypothetical protein PHW21_01475 [Candidatus Izemoplasmatales bacterium]|nr:hypothetical protein [Candidatus Izemoplasmatales bacterium]